MRRALFAMLAGAALASAMPVAAAAAAGGEGSYRRGDQPQSYPDESYPQERGNAGDRRGDGDYRRGDQNQSYPDEDYPRDGRDRRGRWGRGGCDGGAYGDIQSELQRLYERVRRGQYDGSYSRDSARNFYRAIRLDQQYLDYYSNDGCLDRGELNDLRYRLDALRDQMRQYDRRRGRGRW